MFVLTMSFCINLINRITFQSKVQKMAQANFENSWTLKNDGTADFRGCRSGDQSEQW